MTPLRLARLNLARRRFTTVMAILSIALAVACSGILLRLYNSSASRFSTLGAGGDAVIGAKAGGIEILLNSLNGEGEFPDFLPLKLFQTLRAQQNVQFEDGAVATPDYLQTVIPFVYFGLYGSDRVVGTDETFYQRPRSIDSLVLREGRWFNKVGEVVLGALVAQAHGLKVGDSISVSPWVGTKLPATLPLTVVGVLQPAHSTWDKMLYASLEQAQIVFNMQEEQMRGRSIWGAQVLHYFLVYLKDNGFVPLEALVNKRTVGQVVRVEEEKDRLLELTGVGKTIGLFVTGLVIILGSLCVCAMLVTRFDGMSVQMAVLRALGFTRREVTSWLLWEGLLLGLSGCFLGAILDGIGFPQLRGVMGNALPPADLVPSYLFESYPVWLVALAAVVLAVVVPLSRLYAQDVHNSLRGL